jgi:hypothetical protein|tara:strand:- start:5223 stop:6002 length:780 start_codon:yes stop_codon:yes gene_type:complete
MNISEIRAPITSKAINESLAKKFGVKINVDKFTVEQLEDARNKIRTKMSQFETNESFDQVHSNDEYQKNKLFLDVLNQAISERDVVNDEDQVDETPNPKKKIKEGEEDKAEIIMAAKDMVDKITGWMEDTAEMQAESMLELGDAVRDELGNAESEQYISSVKPTLEALYDQLEITRGVLSNGVAMLTGEQQSTMGTGEEEAPMEPMDAEADLEPTVDQEDDFAAAEPAAGGEEEAGREKRESVNRSRKLGLLLSGKKKT